MGANLNDSTKREVPSDPPVLGVSLIGDLNRLYHSVRQGIYIPEDPAAAELLLDDVRAAWNYHRRNLDIQGPVHRLIGDVAKDDVVDIWAQRVAECAQNFTFRASMNVHVCTDLVRALDSLILSGEMIGYKFGNPDIRWTINRHDSLTLYFLVPPSEALRASLIEITTRFARSLPGEAPFENDHLMGEQVCYGLRLEPKYSRQHLVKLMNDLDRVDEELSDGAMAWATKSETRELQISNGQVEAIRLLAAERGIVVRYVNEAAGFSVGADLNRR